MRTEFIAGKEVTLSEKLIKHGRGVGVKGSVVVKICYSTW
jgi:hypothetical protein